VCVHQLFNTVLSAATGPGVFATRVAQIEFGPEVASNLKLVGGVALSEREVATIIAPLEGLGKVGRSATCLHDDVGLAIGEHADLLELYIAYNHGVIALPESGQQVGGEAVAITTAVGVSLLFEIGALAAHNHQSEE